MKKRKLIYIDLFAGCGGLSLGLHNSNWDCIFAIEKNIDAFNTFKHNLIDKKKHLIWPAWLHQTNHEINFVIDNFKEELKSLEGSIDLIAGGPPCQGFSLAGKRQKNDLRNKLSKSYIEFVNIVKPKIIFFENVKGFTHRFNLNDKNEIPFSKQVMNSLEKNYILSSKIINFSEYGIPQKRERFILVGFNKENFETNIAENFFINLEQSKTNFLKEKKIKSQVTVKEAISDLLKENGIQNSPDSKKFFAGLYGKVETPYQNYSRRGILRKGFLADSHRFPNHTKHIEDNFSLLIKESGNGNKINDKLRAKLKTKKRNIQVLSPNTQSPTLTCLPDDCIHYSEPRILTVREYARLQSFPDSYEFKGKYTTGGLQRRLDVPRYTQIGNAIPPLFAELCGIVLKEMISG